MLTVFESQEWQSAAQYYARCGRLPNLLSHAVASEIAEHPDDWEREVRVAKYADARTASDPREPRRR